MPKLPGAEDLGPAPSGRSGRAIASVDTTAIGRGIATLGAGVASLGDSLRVRETRQKETVDQATRFEAERRFLQFEQERGLALQDMGQREAPGAFGFRERYQEDYLKAAREFYQTVPDELKPAFDVKLMQTERRLLDGDGGAGAFERSARTSYYKTNVSEGLTALENKLYSNPSSFDDLVWEGEQFIDAIPDDDVSPIEKDALRREWKAKAQLASLNGMAPTERLRALGEMPANTDILRAIENVESNGNPDAVSRVGATGLMQIMPGTGQEIAEELGDRNFPVNGGIDRITAYLKRPDVSRAYGAHYFNKMMRRYDGDVEAALVAYNGGPGRADAWLAAGRNDAVIPKESADYYKKVLGRVEGAAPGPRDTGADLPVISVDMAGRSGSPDIGRVQPVVIDRFKQLQNAFGASIPIVSGFRDPERNARAGGASQSRHMHGDALDLDVSNLSTDERVRLIQQASAAGFTGIGVYSNSIHIDLGGRRAWGPTHKSESVPGWAKGVIEQHLANRAPKEEVYGRAGYQVDPRFADMGYQQRETMAAATRNEIEALRTAQRVQADAAYKAYDDAFALNIELGNVVSEEQILGDPRLTVADVTKHLKRFRTVQEEGISTRDAIAAFASGQLAVDPYAADGKKTVDNVWKAVSGVLDDAQSAAMVQEMVRQTRTVPQAVMNQIRLGLTSSDLAEVVGAAQLASTISQIDPAALGTRDGGGDVQRAADDFGFYVNRLNLSPDEAAKRIAEAQNPDAKRDRKALEPLAADFRKALADEDIGAMFDESWLGWRGNPAVGFTPQQAATIQLDYMDIAENEFYRANGNAELAKNRAQEQMKRLYGVTSLTGQPTVIKHPPENYWPKARVQMYGNTFSVSDNQSLDYATFQLRRDMREVYPDADMSRVILMTTPQTDAEVKRGDMPGYGVLYIDDDGMMQTPFPGQHWRPDVAQAREWEKPVVDKEREDEVRRAQEMDVIIRRDTERLRRAQESQRDAGRIMRGETAIMPPEVAPDPAPATETNPMLQGDL